MSRVTAYIPLYIPNTDIPCGEAEIEVYPVAEGNGRWDDVYARGLDGKLYTLSDEVGRAVLSQIEKEQPLVWQEIRMAGGDNSTVAWSKQLASVLP